MRFIGCAIFICLANFGFAQSGFVSPECYNTSGDEYGYRNVEGKVYIVSDAKDSTGSLLRDKTNSKNFTDLYEIVNCEKREAKLRKEGLQEPVSMNSSWYDGPVSYNANDSILFFANANEGLIHGQMGIYWSKKNQDGAYSAPIAFPYNSSEYSCMHPYYDPSTRLLYFVSNLSTDSTGFDLYRVRFSNGVVGELQAINGLNTKNNELFPIIYKETLYFTATRADGLGGMDIFSSNDFTTVTCLPAPINSSADDLSIFFTAENRGFVSSNRGNSGTKGDDIYQFYLPKLKTKEPVVDNPNSALLAELDVLYQKLEKENDPNAVLIKKAMLRLEEQDKQTQQLAREYNNSSIRMMQYIDTASALSFEEKLKLYEQVIADDYLIMEETDPEELANQQKNQNSGIASETTHAGVPKVVDQNTAVSADSTASDNGGSASDSLDSSAISQTGNNSKQSYSNAAFQKLAGKPLETTDSTARAMVDAFVGEKFQLTDAKEKLAKEKSFIDQTLTPFVAQNNNIDLKLIAEHFQLSLDELNTLMASSYPITFYFDFDKSVIKKEEEEKLNYLLNLVKTFEGSIRIEGHTDSKGRDAYNLKLSAKRTQKVYGYLVNYGISKDAITRVNFGESMPVADNDTKEGRALNRRVVVILNKGK